MHIPYELYLALRYLRFHRGRTLVSVITVISVAGVIVGTAALVIALSLNAGFVRDVRERIHSGSAHLTVLSSGDAPWFPGGRELAGRLARKPGVRAAAEVVYTPALVTSEELGFHAFAEVHGIEHFAHSVNLRPPTPICKCNSRPTRATRPLWTAPRHTRCSVSSCRWPPSRMCFRERSGRFRM